MGVSKNRGTPKWMVYKGNPNSHMPPLVLDAFLYKNTVSHQKHTSDSPTSLWGAFECTKPFIRDRLREGKDVAIFVGGAQVLGGESLEDSWQWFWEEKGGGEGCLQGGPALQTL